MLRFGCLGAARITPTALIGPARKRSDISIAAVASRNEARAHDFAAKYDIPAIETSYQALIERSDVDVIYNALPPNRHMDLTLAALNAGKPVLCEKPVAMNAHQAAAMAEASQNTGVFLMEAFHYRFHPAFQKIVNIVRGGDLGRLKRFKAVFSVAIPETADELRHDPALGGGALMDLGCYPVHWARTLLGSGEVLSAEAITGRPGVDVTLQAELIFDGGVAAELYTSMAKTADREASLEIIGSDGRLNATNPLAPHLGHKIEMTRAQTGASIIVSESAASEETTYDYQLTHFVDCLNGRAEPLLPADDAVQNMQMIDAIYHEAGLSPRGT